MGINTAPMLTGEPVSVAQLEAAFGPIEGAVMGYGEGEFGEDGRLRWCAAVLPGNKMQYFLRQRAKRMSAAGENPRKPFLIAMGSLKRAADYGGTPRALCGVGLAFSGNREAKEMLHSDDLKRKEFLKTDGAFKWDMGVPYLRVWLPAPPVPFSDIVGYEPRQFGRSDGQAVIPLENLVPGLTTAIRAIQLREVVLDRPSTTPDIVLRDEKRYREGYLVERGPRYERVRSASVRDAALDANLEKYGNYTCEETGCGYTAAADPGVSPDKRRRMFEVHHRIHISAGERHTSLDDVAVLCPRCHRREHLATEEA
ncbi:hypothetical protein FHR90_003335 [Endobacter medicaginis]|uniref:HNH endonuclease n=1 Tax=Endobacter medicaginis TaxID=1181271 RepID=A0A850NJM0_9PROT|nr:HNH endonuclease [Endobacter medicaginis]MBB3175479.1 hypothetical protein [Endobacter medicaginis]MCX5477130.1 HNH endonuclease [Endobacter medicaginis]NVN29813.1 HNH endonuclease [Endobacter medicaginis]